MKIESIKELGQVIDLCRRKGVLSIEIDNVKLALGEAPRKLKTEEPKSEKIETPDEYTQEQILMWSSAGLDG